MKNIFLFITVLFSFLLSDVYEGYLREIEASMCMDQCSEYMLESESGVFLANVTSLNQIDLSYFVDRYVQIQADSEYLCLMCSALIIEDIVISNDCNNPFSCFVNPCDIEECDNNISADCIPNYCEGCYADFYDLNGSLITCDSQIVNPCDDLADLDFGMCDMYLGVAIVNGECQYLSGCGWTLEGVDYSNAFFNDFSECEQNCLDELPSCVDIEYDYNQYHSELYTVCESDDDCISIWGDCGVGLGGCHYSVNELLYLETEVDQLVSLWIEQECMEWVCDCMPLPDSFCNNGNCDLGYCLTDNPAGCFSNGCPDNFECLGYEFTNDCVASSCFCDEFYDDWFCTEDCNGGTCFELGDINYNGSVDVVDVVSIVNIILGLNPANPLSDINSDNIINIIDVILLVDNIIN